MVLIRFLGFIFRKLVSLPYKLFIRIFATTAFFFNCMRKTYTIIFFYAARAFSFGFTRLIYLIWRPKRGRMSERKPPRTRVLLNGNGFLTLTTDNALQDQVDDDWSCCYDIIKNLQRAEHVAFVSSIGQSGLHEYRIINRLQAPSLPLFPTRSQLHEDGILCTTITDNLNRHLKLHFLDLNVAADSINFLDRRFVEFCWRISSTMIFIVDEKSNEKLFTSLNDLPVAQSGRANKSAIFVFFFARAIKKTGGEFASGRWISYEEFAKDASELDMKTKSVLSLLEIAKSRFTAIKIGFSRSNGGDLVFDPSVLLNRIRRSEITRYFCRTTDVEQVFKETRNIINSNYNAGHGPPTRAGLAVPSAQTQQPKRRPDQGRDDSERYPLLWDDQVTYNNPARDEQLVLEREMKHVLGLYENLIKSATAESFFSNENFHKMNDKILGSLQTNSNPCTKLIVSHTQFKIQLKQIQDRFYEKNAVNVQNYERQRRKDIKFTTNALRSLGGKFPKFEPMELVIHGWEIFRLRTMGHNWTDLYEEEAAEAIRGEVADIAGISIASIPPTSEFRGSEPNLLDGNSLRNRISQLLACLDESGNPQASPNLAPEILPVRKENVTLEALAELVTRVDMLMLNGAPRGTVLVRYVQDQQEEAKALLTQSHVPLSKIRKCIQQHTVLIEQLEEQG